MLTGVDALGAFLGVEPQGRKVPDVTGKGGLSYEAALKTADEIVNHLFGTGMEDYELEFAEIVHWENRDTCRYVFAPVVSGLPLGSAAFTLDIRSQEEWGVSFQLYTVENIETPDLELVSFAKVQETLKAALARTDLYTLMGLSPQETPASIENIRLEYLTFADGKRILLLPAWVMDGFLRKRRGRRRPAGQYPVLLRTDRSAIEEEGRAVSAGSVRTKQQKKREACASGFPLLLLFFKCPPAWPCRCGRRLPHPAGRRPESAGR